MIDQKPKTHIYKQLQNVIYLLSIYRNNITIYSKFLEKVMGYIGWKKYGFYRQKKVMGFISKFRKSCESKQQSKQIKKLTHKKRKQHKMK
jgi:hypothetical protein